MLKKNLQLFSTILLACILFGCTPIDSVSTNNQEINSAETSRGMSSGVDLTGTWGEGADSPIRVSINGNLWDDMQDYLQLPDYSFKPEVQKQITWYQKHQYYLNQIIKQAAPFLYYVYQQTRQRNLPAELALLPIIESNYNPFLYSKAGANGLWQIMPGTASGFGLKIDWWYDGRRDIISSTHAALDYLSYLNDFFTNDWLLAIAAYDCGEGAVQNSVKRNKKYQQQIDFWSLHLPDETQRYLPKLLALTAIIRDPDRYNIKLLPINDAPYLAQVDIGSQIDLAQAAKLAGISLDEMHNLNPGYRRWATDPAGPYRLLVPANKVDGFRQRLDSLPKSKRVTWQQHTVQEGDTIGGIAHKYHTKLSVLKDVNHLKQNTIKPGKTLIIPVAFHGSLNSPIVKQRATIAEDQLPGPQKVSHVIQEGDTLWTIADKYKVTPREIRYWNKLGNKETLLTPDNKLLIWAPEHRAHINYNHHYLYKVQPDDNLSIIAERFNSSSNEILRANRNNIKKHLLHPGQVLTIPAKGYRIIHTIKPGDNLITIAHKFHVQAKDIKKWNNIKDSRLLRPGKKLYVYPV